MTTQEKPKCRLTGTDSNIFALVGKVAKTLKRAGRREQAEEMANRVFASGSYHEALGIIQEYVEAS